jgi:hypothetical protein
MTDIQVEVKTTIRLLHPKQVAVTVDFASRDIGMTQGVTLSQGPHILAQYRPGTSHRKMALEITVKALTEAFTTCVEERDDWTPQTLGAVLTEVLERKGCQLWDGQNIWEYAPDDEVTWGKYGA